MSEIVGTFFAWLGVAIICYVLMYIAYTIGKNSIK